MRFADYCREAEVRLAEIQTGLLNPRSEQFENCEIQLGQIASELRRRADLVEPLDREDGSALVCFMRSMRRLGYQVDHGARLCRGWAQLRDGAGYDHRGLPALANAESGISYEV